MPSAARRSSAAERRRLGVTRAIRQVLTTGGLALVYQPVVNLHTGRFAGVEALLRCPASPLGELSPADFIPVTETSALIHDVGRWVLDAAIRDTTGWPSGGPDRPDIVVAVNVSPRQLLHPGFGAQVSAVLAEYGLDPQRLCLEVTETALVDVVEPIVRALRDLRQRGVRLAIDDFGSGHASLTYLARFPVDDVKIDQTFIRDLATDRRSLVIVQSVAAMAHALGMTVTAEGVETLEQLEALLDAGVDAAQGFLFAPAAQSDAAHQLVANTIPWPVELAGRRTRQVRAPEPTPVDPARRYRLLIDVARDITAAPDLDAVLRLSFEALRRLLRFTGGSIQLLDAGMLALAATDPPATTEALGARVPIGQGVGGLIAATGEPRYIPDITVDADVPASRRAATVSGGVRSYFAAPLIAGGRIIGVLQIDSVAVDAFSVEDQTLVLAFAPIVAASVTQVTVGRIARTPTPRRPVGSA
ncbi:MAG TPA: EAL domain-containing protein [Mycobacteriales bacterium]|nr:EAL domain-containing protein [Mycobacteriales bacterium]